MSIQLKISKDINLILLFILILKVNGINEEILFIVSMIYLFILVFRNKKIHVPKITGIAFYSWIIIYATMIGIVVNPIRDVVRDLYYILPTVSWIFIGYYLCKQNSSKDKLLRTLYIYGSINSIVCFINLILNPSISFNNLRTIFGINVYDIGLIVPIFIYQVFLYKKKVFGKKTDIFMIIIMILQIIMSFGRISIFIPLIVLFVILYLELIGKQNRKKTGKLIIKITGLLIVVLVISINILPSNIIDTFTNKLMNSFKEIKYSQQINSVGEAMNNWRAYEMKSAINEWKGSNLFIKIFGEGLGKGTKIEFIPYSWVGVVVNNEIPLLHNGFYSLLMKCGLVGVFSLIWIFIGNILKGLMINKINKNNSTSAIILVAISVGAILNTYVVRGPIQQGAFLVWAILLGSINYELNKKI